MYLLLPKASRIAAVVGLKAEVAIAVAVAAAGATPQPFSLPALAYAYNALEPHFDARTMEIHHSKHNL